MRAPSAATSAASSGAPSPAAPPQLLARGELVRRLYRLGHTRATGVLSVVAPADRQTLLVLRRGQLMTADSDPQARRAAEKLAWLCSFEELRYAFDGGTAAYPPGAVQRQLHLARWARVHLERQVDAAFARQLARDIAGARLRLRPELMPDASLCDETDLRILAAMSPPRRIDEIAPLARAPRFRLIAFFHFLHQVGAVEPIGVAAPGPEAACHEADRLLALGQAADPEALKRTYRRLVRALHPDLQPDVDPAQRRLLERKLAELTCAYRSLRGAARTGSIA